MMPTVMERVANGGARSSENVVMQRSRERSTRCILCGKSGVMVFSVWLGICRLGGGSIMFLVDTMGFVVFIIKCFLINRHFSLFLFIHQV